MKKITDFIVSHSIVILIIMLVLTGISGLLATQVRTNHDISKYMPSDSETSLGLELMDAEFSSEETSSYSLMFDDLSETERVEVLEYIENVPGVKEVAHDQTEDYEKDNHSLYEITVEGPADGETAASVYNTIHDHYNGVYKMTGKGDVYSNNATVLSIWIILVAVGCAMLILIVMSSSYVEPFLFLAAIMIGVVLNYGTNIIFEDVSHITSAIAAILQMALSMDYAIMLASRYQQERQHEHDKHKAMRTALSKAFGSITASSITTVVGLFVLVFMSFTIGRDMGLVLSKGVILSLLSIFTCLPAFLLVFDKLIKKTKKRSFSPKLDLLGKFAYKIRHVTPFIFIAILGTSFLLKGNVGILYTDSEMDKIKDIFPENNQIAVIYDNSMEDRVAGYCKDYEERNDVTQILCYSNTINEPETVSQLTAKFTDLGTEIDVKDYLLKVLYYHYYNSDESHTMTVTDFVNFLQNDVFTNPDFADQITDDMKSQINRLANFTDPAKINQPRSIADLSSILEIDQSKLADLMVYYGSKSDNGVTMTLAEFVNFINSDVLTNPTYAKNIDASTRSKLDQLSTFTNKSFINAKKTPAELASTFGMSGSQVQSIFQYYLYTTITDTSTKLTTTELVDFATTNSTVSAQLTDEQKQLFALLLKLDDTGNKYTYSEYPEAIKNLITTKVTQLTAGITEAVTANYTLAMQQYQAAVEQIIAAGGDPSTIPQPTVEQVREQVMASLSPDQKALLNMAPQLENLDTAALTTQLKQIYIVYDITQALPGLKLSPLELVNFLLAHSNDEMLQGQLSSSALSSLQLAQFVMNSTDKDMRFSSTTLAGKLSMDASSLRLLYSLYNYKRINPNPTISLNNLVDFMLNDVANSAEYGNEISADQRTNLTNIQKIMQSATSATQLNHTQMYQLLSPLSSDLKSTLIDIIYIYHGSVVDYNNEWTMTVEQFVNYLNDNILEDDRFSDLITPSLRTKITDAKTTIKDAKNMLVGDHYSRAIINTHYGAEGEETFTFIQRLKDVFGENSTKKVYVIGNSPMAYEMSQTFNDEMNFITILTMVAIFVVVAVTFRSILIPIILVLLIQTAVWITMSILSLTSSSVYFIAMIIVQSILMGATIDYAILYTSYYLEGRRAKMEVKDAVINAYNKSIHTILTSASILIIVTAIVGNFASAIAAKICTTISQGTLCSAILILLLLPPLLAVADKLIVHKPKKSKNSRKLSKNNV